MFKKRKWRDEDMEEDSSDEDYDVDTETDVSDDDASDDDSDEEDQKSSISIMTLPERPSTAFSPQHGQNSPYQMRYRKDWTETKESDEKSR